jgi:adenine phosphoribosyltransferase
MVQNAGGVVAGIGFVVELTFLKGRERLAGHDVFSLLQYDK